MCFAIHRSTPQVAKVAALCAVALASLQHGAAQNLAPNPGFESGTTNPTAWRLEGATGTWSEPARTGRHAIQIEGDGSNSGAWQSEALALEQGLLAGKIGRDRVFQPGEFRSNTGWNDWLIPVNRRRVLDLLASWQDLTDKYACTLSQLVIAWTAAQPGVTHVLVGGRTLAQATENAQGGELNLETADLARIRQDVIALGEPVKA